MKNRLLSLPEQSSYFLFGARGTGKSTLLKDSFAAIKHLYIDLLDIQQERRYLRDPQRLQAEVLALPDDVQYVLIDEVQKIPDLLNVVHALIESTNKLFVLTGSSARKLKQGHANLLAGRAMVRNLYPFSFVEMGDDFELDVALTFGLLPKVCHLANAEQKTDFLRAYTHTYLKEEVWAEHLIRKLEPFQYFLEVAAQANGDVINYSNIARDVGVDHKTVEQYFSILVDTLLGFQLPAFKHSFRKRLNQKAKFYLFDTGVTRALARHLTVPLAPRSHEYGKAFEHFVILESFKLASYNFPDYRFNYFRDNEGPEIDLVVERPGQPLLMIEIKSSEEVRSDHLKHLKSIADSFPDAAEYVCFARVPRTLKLDDIMVYPWAEGIKRYFS